MLTLKSLQVVYDILELATRVNLALDLKKMLQNE